MRCRSAAIALLLSACATVPAPPPSGLAGLSAVGQVDERFLSYNVEMVEVTGGKFWRPYGSKGSDPKEYRAPLDLSDPTLRRLAAALAPAYIRFSGTWANATWFSDTEEAGAAPAGFDTVLTRRQWRGAVDFAKAARGDIVTSFATSPGTRDAAGVWQSDMAARWLAYTRRIGGRIAATEFANEPNMMWLTQPPAGYDGAGYRRDYTRFAGWLKTASPGTLLLAPGVAELGEPVRTRSRNGAGRKVYEADDLLTAAQPMPDAYSFHYYGGASERCGGKIFGQTLVKAIAPEWLDSVDVAIARMKEARDRVKPGLPLWNTESAESSCGGNPWASSFADSFRFVDTLGRSARQGVRVFIHNTLAASDYALLDEDHTPRPDYWAAWLWKRTMGQVVLAAPAPQIAQLRSYAHCLPKQAGGLPGQGGGVGLAVVNVGEGAQTLALGGAGQAWTMQAPALDSKAVAINGARPALTADGRFTGLDGVSVSGSVMVPARSIVFVAVPGAANRACRQPIRR